MNIYEDNWLKPSSRAVLTLVSLLLGSGALWLASFRYERLVSQTDAFWYNWVQLAGIALVGVLCLGSTMLFVLGRRSAQDTFKIGLSLIPILLFANLIVFLSKVFQNVLQGNTGFFFERLFAQPYKAMFVLFLVIALGVLGSLNERKE